MKSFTILLLAFSMQVIAYDQNVIFITWDGVRYEEFFGGKSDPSIATESTSILEKFWDTYANQGIVLGDEDSDSSMLVSNDSTISYPAYLSMMNGIHTDYCHLNQPIGNCRRNPNETFPERLLKEKNLDKSKVAVFASWDRIKDAAESIENSLTVSAGPVEFNDPNFPGAHDTINARMRDVISDRHYQNGERDDATTFSHAMTYLKNNRPKFMFIYLLETDGHGHGNRYKEYVSAINENDKKLSDLIETLEKMGAYGKNTSIVLTTDHGRGKGSLGWMHHGVLFKNSKKVWAYIKGPATKGLGKLKKTNYSHINLRPTMELMLGLEPLRRENIIKEAF